MRLFRRREKAKEKWHTKALFVDPRKTKIILETTKKRKKPKKPKRLPQWLIKKRDHLVEDPLSISNINLTLRNIRKQYLDLTVEISDLRNELAHKRKEATKETHHSTI